VAVVLTLAQTKQIRINMHKNTKNIVQTIQNTVNTSTSIHIPKHPHNYQNTKWH